MKINRRKFIRTAAAGTAGIALGVTPVIKQSRDPIDRLYENSIVIDTLCVARNWDKEEFEALSQSGYTGIQTSLHNRTWDGALSNISKWNDRIDKYSDVFLKATKASHFRQAKKENKLAVMYGHQNATMIENKIDRLDIA